MKVKFAKDFFEELGGMSNEVKSGAVNAVQEFLSRENPYDSSSLHFEKLQSTDNFYSIRPNNSGWRILLTKQNDGTYVFERIGREDELYPYANRRKEISRAAEKLDSLPEVAEKGSEEFAAYYERQTRIRYLFACLTIEELKELGVPESRLVQIRKIREAEEWERIKGDFPDHTQVCLDCIIDNQAVSEVMEMLRGEEREMRQEDVQNDSAPESTGKSEGAQICIKDSEAELRSALGASMEDWRIFLHPKQMACVHGEYRGPVRVTGTAGTGKTVVALYRARYLARKPGAESGSIFVTVFDSNLANDLKESLKRICSEEEFLKIKVQHIDEWVSDFRKNEKLPFNVMYNETDPSGSEKANAGKKGKSQISNLMAAWKTAIINADTGLSFGWDFFKEEWDRVITAQGAFSQEQYLNANRSGRGIRLTEQDKKLVWSVAEQYMQLMKAEGKRDINWAMCECAERLQGHPPMFSHIIVDECQDLSGSAYRLLRAMAGEEHENDLFIVGDVCQSIYRRYPVMSQCGINIIGRSQVLRLNYRTTDQIRRFASPLIQEMTSCDPEADYDKMSTSLTEGASPEIVRCGDADDEFRRVKERVRKLHEAGYGYHEICVAARSTALVKKCKEQFDKSSKDMGDSFGTFLVKGGERADEQGKDFLRFATMHRVKGLEFKCVILVSVNQGVIPDLKNVNPANEASKKEAVSTEKSLLYVAMTRAREQLYVYYWGKPSEFLAMLPENQN